MEDETSFQLGDTSCQKCAAITLASFLWEKLHIKSDINDLLVRNVKSPTAKSATVKKTLFKLEFYNAFSEVKWWSITEKVKNQIEYLNLPLKLSTYLQELIILMGKKIYSFYIGCTPLKFNLRNIQKIYFTNKGLIDECKMMQDWKKTEIYPNAVEDDLSTKMIAYWTATIDVDKEFFHQESLEEVKRVIQVLIGRRFNIQNQDKAMAVVFIWYMALVKSSYPIIEMSVIQFNSLYSNLLHNSRHPDGADQLFLHSINYCFEKLAKYLYNQLDDEIKESLIIPAAVNCVYNLNISECKEQNFKILLFLLQKMSKDQKKNFLSENLNYIFSALLELWPYQKVLVKMLDYVEIDSLKLILLKNLIVCLAYRSSFKPHDVALTPIYHGILQKILTMIPEDLKLKFFVGNNSYILFRLFEISDFLSIRIILNDDDLEKHRSELIDITKHLTTVSIMNEVFETLELKLINYMKTLAFSNDEKNKLLDCFNNPDLIEKLLHRSCFRTLNLLLKFLNDSDDDKIARRIKTIGQILNPLDIIQYYIRQKKYDSCDSYLKWQYFCQNSEDLNLVKEKIFSRKFICEMFFITWLKRNDLESKTAETFSFRLLKNTFNLSFRKKQELMENENCIKIFCDLIVNECERLDIERRCGRINQNFEELFWLNLTFLKNFPNILQEFFIFCSVSNDEVIKIKEKIKDNIHFWFGLFDTDKFKFLVLNALIGWVEFNEEKKKNVFKSYINSDKGALLCLKIFNLEAEDADGSVAKEILNDWVKEYGNVDKIKEEIRSKIGIVTEDDALRAIEILDEL